MHSPDRPATAVVRRAAGTALPVLLVLAAGLSACGGGGGAEVLAAGPSEPEVELFPLEIQPLGAPLQPLGLLEPRALEWRANQPGTYRVLLRPAGDAAAERELATGVVEAYETVHVGLLGAELALSGPSTVTFALVDEIGRQVEFTQELELKTYDVLNLGEGSFTDLEYDPLRMELTIADAAAGELRLIDVDEEGSKFGAVLATIPSLVEPGPLRLEMGADGRFAYLLGREVLVEYDRDTLELESEFDLPAAAEPTGLVVTPDSGRVYFSHPTTLLTHAVDLPGGLAGTGLVDAGLEGGELAVTPDGSRLLYAWEGAIERGLWIIGSDPQAPDHHDLLVDHRFARALGSPAPELLVSEDGAAAYVLGLEASSLSKIDLMHPELPFTASRSDLSVRGLASASMGEAEFLVAAGPDGSLWVLDSELETVGEVRLPVGLTGRVAVDRAGRRLFLLRTTPAGMGELLVLPLE